MIVWINFSLPFFNYCTDFIFMIIDTDQVMVYIGNEQNPNYLGPSSIEDVAKQIMKSRGERKKKNV